MYRQRNTTHRELRYSVSDQKLKCYTIKLRNYRTQNSHFQQLLVFVIQNQQPVKYFSIDRDTAAFSPKRP